MRTILHRMADGWAELMISVIRLSKALRSSQATCSTVADMSPGSTFSPSSSARKPVRPLRRSIQSPLSAPGPRGASRCRRSSRRRSFFDRERKQKQRLSIRNLLCRRASRNLELNSQQAYSCDGLRIYCPVT